MTTYRLFPSTSGPSSPVSYSGNFLAGVCFKVTQAGLWFTGYYQWIAAGQDTTSRKFALWTITGASTSTLIPAATVASSGTLTAGQWNFIPTAAPVPLAIGTAYVSSTGWSAVSGHGFSDSDSGGAGTGAGDAFGSAGHLNGITNGPLFAWSDGQGSGGLKPEPYLGKQGLFGTAGTDPTVNMPNLESNAGNFWMDCQVTDAGPVNYSGPYSLWLPGTSKFDADAAAALDAAVSYVIATEFALSQACTLDKIWYWSPAGTAQFATSARVWQILGPNSGTSVAANTSPTWLRPSGTAASPGDGWVYCAFTGVTLPPGSYKSSVYNGAATPDQWSSKVVGYFDTGTGGSGITFGPLSAPGLAAASLAYNFNGNPAGTPPNSDGTTLRGQSTFAQNSGDVYPYLYAGGAAAGQSYLVTPEVSIAPALATPAPLVVPPAAVMQAANW